MPTFQGTLVSNYFKRILQVSQTSNTGVDATTRAVQTGDGAATSISISDDVLSVQPQNDDSVATLLCKTNAGNNILAVDTTNKKVLVGASQIAATTQYAHFGAGFDSGSLTFVADYHYAIPFNFMFYQNDVQMGSSTSSSFNDTNPASTLTISTTAMKAVGVYWYVMDDITIDAVKWLHAADDATGDVTAAHLMSYTVDTANGSTGGDLSSGTVLADGATITNSGYEQIYYQSLTIQSADVDAGKVILFTFASDTVNSDFSINATVKYHLR